jgi:Fe-S cluster assembly protein SufD
MTAEVTPIRTAAESGLLSEFANHAASLPGRGAVARQREAALKQFERSGLPHRRIEDWKYTDLRALMRDAKPLASPPDAQAKARGKTAGAIVSGVQGHRIVFVDGAYVAELSDQALEAGVTITSLAAGLARGDSVDSLFAENAGASISDPALELNTAFMADGALVHVARGATVAKPIHLVFVHGGGPATAAFMRSQVVVEEGARVTLIESHEGPDALDYQINAAVGLIVRDRAEVDYIKACSEGNGALHVATVIVSIGARSILRHFTYTLGGAVTRNQLFATCVGKEASVTFAGANLLRHKEHADYTLALDHAIGGCTSRELFKSVLDDESSGVFQGKIIVRPGAQRTDARMLMRALLLSPKAEADHKPELEIFADDVQCGHGSTAGALDENLKFYLMARGIPAHEAEALLIEAFVGEAVETITHQGLRDALKFATARWLGARG